MDHRAALSEYRECSKSIYSLIISLKEAAQRPRVGVVVVVRGRGWGSSNPPADRWAYISHYVVTLFVESCLFKPG